MSLSQAQLAQRRAGISASEVAAIVGLDPYRSPIDVWLDKTNRTQPFVGNLRTKWGHALEPLIRDDYAERRGLRVEVPGTLDHPTVTWAKATPDGVCYVPGNPVPVRGLEIKTHSFRAAHWYGEPGTDQVPPHELIQCTWNLFVSGLDIWDLVSFVDNQPTDYLVTRDDDLILMLRERTERFLVDNVKADKPPEPDGSESYDRYLSTRFSHKDETFVSIDGKRDLLANMRRLRDVRSHLDEFETEGKRLEQELKLAIDDNSGLEWTETDKKKSRIFYRKAKDSEKMDWQGAYHDVVLRAQLALSASKYGPSQAQATEALSQIADESAAAAAHMKVVPGSRRFIVPRAWSKNTKED